jgi:hypothetical protein
MSNICIGLKMTCLGVLDRGERDKDNETGLKEGGGTEMSTTVLPLRDARSIRFYTHLYLHRLYLLDYRFLLNCYTN